MAKLVTQDADGIWLAPALAAEKSGLTKPELARRALAGILRFREDKFGRPCWYAEPDITALARDRMAADRAKPKVTKRKPSQAQLEARYAKQIGGIAATSNLGRGGPVTAHYERVMIADIHAARKPKPG